MSLLFGDLTQDFVDFNNAIQSIDTNDPQSTARVDEAAKRFRHIAAQDAAYLVYIGA
jgi:ATP-binding cassette subfamily B (MDR/TAP) protein 1